MSRCSRPRCDLPIAGVGESYGLCVRHGHEERDRRLRERDARAPAATLAPQPLRPNLTATLPRPLSAVVGARPVPTTIQPSAATEAAKEPSMAQPLVLKTTEPPAGICRIQGCETHTLARGLCATHYSATTKAGRLDELALPSTAPPRKPKPVATTPKKPTPPLGTLDKLHAERDAAVARAERAETTLHDLEALVRSQFAYAPGALDLFGWVRDIASKVQEAKLRFEAWEARDMRERSMLERVCAALGISLDDDTDPEWVMQVLRERVDDSDEIALLNESIELAKVLGVDTSGDYDLLARAREVMAERAAIGSVDQLPHATDTIERLQGRIATLTTRVEDLLTKVCAELGIDLDGGDDWVLAQLRERIAQDALAIAAANRVAGLQEADRAEMLPWVDAAKTCAEALGVTTPAELIEGAKELGLDQHPPGPRGRSMDLDVAIRHILPASRPYRVKQAGQRDLGVLVGFIDDITSVFRVTAGPLEGAVYGCLYSAEPVERPELGEPEPGATVWVRTVIDEVTPTTILTSDGGRHPRAEWAPDCFVRRTMRPAAVRSPRPPVVVDDDIPF